MPWKEARKDDVYFPVILICSTGRFLLSIPLWRVAV